MSNDHTVHGGTMPPPVRNGVLRQCQWLTRLLPRAKGSALRSSSLGLFRHNPLAHHYSCVSWEEL